MLLKRIILSGLLVASLNLSFSMSRADSLLTRCNATITLNDQLEMVEREYMHKIPHHLCLSDKAKGAFEVRIFYYPLDSTFAWYNRSLEKDPDAELMKPNDLCKSMMLLAVLNASNNRVMSFDIIPKGPLRESYQADWMATALVEVPYENFAFKFCRVICIHQDNFGDIYLYYLTNKAKLMEKVELTMKGVIQFNK